MIVLVCGDREYSNWQLVHAWLTKLHEAYGITKIVQGAARGADLHASTWARLNRVEDTGDKYKPDWDNEGRSAGIKRNVEMLHEEAPDLVLGFPGCPGTNHMTTLAAENGVATLLIPDLEWEAAKQADGSDLDEVVIMVDEEGEVLFDPTQPHWLHKPTKGFRRLAPVGPPTPEGCYDEAVMF